MTDFEVDPTEGGLRGGGETSGFEGSSCLLRHFEFLANASLVDAVEVGVVLAFYSSEDDWEKKSKLSSTFTCKFDAGQFKVSIVWG